MLKAKQIIPKIKTKHWTNSHLKCDCLRTTSHLKCDCLTTFTSSWELYHIENLEELNTQLYMWLINRFHVAVRLFRDYCRSQMSSKWGKKEKVAHDSLVECVTDVLTTFWHLLWSITEQMDGNMESTYLFYAISLSEKVNSDVIYGSVLQ